MTKNGISRPGNENFETRFSSEMIASSYTPSNNGSANFTISSPALGIIIFLFFRYFNR